MCLYVLGSIYVSQRNARTECKAVALMCPGYTGTKSSKAVIKLDRLAFNTFSHITALTVTADT